MSSRRGLPSTLQPRHDRHYVESLSGPAPEPLGKHLPVAEIEANRDQPRSNIGDLSELKRSIESKGIIEPIIVRRLGSKYQIISGERRFRAARELGLTEVPCIVRDADDLETLEVALIENLQRKDLTPFEEADGLKQLAERYGHTHEEISRKIGKSRTSITETLSLTAIPSDIRGLCEKHGVQAKSMLLQVARQETAAEMLDLANNIIKRGISRQEARAVRHGSGTEKPKPHTFHYKPDSGEFTLKIQFKKSQVENEEIASALRRALSFLGENGD